MALRPCRSHNSLIAYDDADPDDDCLSSFLGLFEIKEPSKALFWVCLMVEWLNGWMESCEKNNVLIQGQRTIGHWLKLAFWRPGAHLGTRAGILAPRRAFGHAHKHFGALGREFGHANGYFGTRACIGHAGGHFGTRAHVWAWGKEFGV